MTTEDEHYNAEDACYDEAKRHAADITNLFGTLDRLAEHDKDQIRETLEQSMYESVLEVSKEVTYTVLLGTGGPAYGIDFTESGTTVWHQDWGTPRVHVSLDSDLADRIAEHLGIDFEDDDR